MSARADRPYPFSEPRRVSCPLPGDGSASWNAIAVSLIASCRLHDIEPWAYLRDMLTLLPAWNHTRAIELAPAYWQQTREQPKTLELLKQRQLMGRGAQHQQQDAVGRPSGPNGVQ